MRELLQEALSAAIAAADPAEALPGLLPPPPAGRLLVVGAGKAAEPMARAVWTHYSVLPHGPRPAGVVVAPHVPARSHRPSSAEGNAVETAGAIRVLRGAHPVPDEHGRLATAEVLATARSAREGDQVVALFSGGGSALLTAPAGVSAESKAVLTRRLLAAGADIGEINTVRKHLSHVKGGRLAALILERGAALLTVAISDVAGDDPSTIASGPTVPDPTTFALALQVVERFAPDMVDVREALTRGVNGAVGAVEESPKPGDPRLADARFVLAADPAASLRAAERVLRRGGFEVINLGPVVVGEAREVGARHADLVRELVRDRPVQAGPVALLSGGELTVTLSGAAAEWPAGRGGPNGEYALAVAAGILAAGGSDPDTFRENQSGFGAAGRWRAHVLAVDTDGLDGGGSDGGGSDVDGSDVDVSDVDLQHGGAAGALLGPLELVRLNKASIGRALEEHDSHGLLQSVGGLVVTGPTNTNVNDLRIVLLVPETND